MKAFTYGVAALLLTFSGAAQAQTSASPGAPRVPSDGTCASQHVAQPNLSASDLLSQSYEIKAAVPGGLWLQKKQDVFYCNSGLLKDGDTMCWKLRAPLKGQDCAAALGDLIPKDRRS